MRLQVLSKSAVRLLCNFWDYYELWLWRCLIVTDRTQNMGDRGFTLILITSIIIFNRPHTFEGHFKMNILQRAAERWFKKKPTSPYLHDPDFEVVVLICLILSRISKRVLRLYGEWVWHTSRTDYGGAVVGKAWTGCIYWAWKNINKSSQKTT